MSDLSQLASQIHRGRGEFSSLFDQVRMQGGFAGDPFMLLAIGLHNNEMAYVKAFEVARENNWLPQLVEQLSVSRFFSENDQTITSLQGILNPSEGFDDPSQIQAGLLRLMRQVCLVTVDDGAQGSGFLIGPNAVMTSWHVIAALLDSDGNPKPGSAKQLRVKFDHLSNRDIPEPFHVIGDEWLSESSPCHAQESAQIDAATTADSTSDALAGYLDFAIIRLQSCPGSERGYVNLADAVHPKKGQKGYVVQHPQAFQQRISAGEFSGFRPDTNDERLLYTMNTLGGSSGGVVVDSRFRLVALHQGEVPGKGGAKPEFNTGIVARRISSEAGEDHHPDPTLVPLFRVANKSAPILGRVECQRWIWECVRGEARIANVYSEPGRRGKSFSAEILRACLPPTDHIVAQIPASNLPVDAPDTAKAILRALRVEHTELPEPDEGDTSHSAWIKASLFPAFEQRLNNAPHPGLFWLVIDDIDRDKLVDAGVRHFLEVLYQEISAIPRLRIVLIGFRGRPPGADSSVIIDEEITDPLRSDIDRYLRLRYVESEFEFMNDEIKRLTSLVHRSGGSEITKLSGYVNETVDRVIDSAVRELN